VRDILGCERGGPWFFFCRSRELFASKSVWRFLFEGDELDDFSSVLTWNVHVLLMTTGMMLISAFSVPWC